MVIMQNEEEILEMDAKNEINKKIHQINHLVPQEFQVHHQILHQFQHSLD